MLKSTLSLFGLSLVFILVCDVVSLSMVPLGDMCECLVAFAWEHCSEKYCLLNSALGERSLQSASDLIPIPSK